ncbi:MAG: DUF4160 domain-containing protein [Candidatus Riflebacteria bacterium]|jgi:hypothetical protein|nr:DUF4160 domain-containing protein [Candidatus Riflebacteria bacterium]
MPKLFVVGDYIIYFWTHESTEPIHVHISRGKPNGESTKVWLTSKGGCIVANNKSRIPLHKLGYLLRIIEAQYEDICHEWKKLFGVSRIKFYC